MDAILLALGLIAQDAAVQPQTARSVVDVASAVEDAGSNPVSPVALDLLGRLPATLEDWEAEGREGAFALQAFPMVGREDLVARFQPGAYDATPCPRFESGLLNPFLDAARDAQIVIVNEAHNQPLHRDFVGMIADILKDDFDVFAAETFNYLRLMVPREPGALGFYDREPIFHRQVDAIGAAGYRLVAYEIRAAQRDPNAQTPAERIAVREEAQADNLIAEALADEPDARILIHVGYSHVLEAPDPRIEDEPPLEWFALRLKQKTGIDPVTISQTHCAMPPPAEAEGGEATPPEPSQPAYLVDPSGIVPDGALDFAIVHPPMVFDAGRPTWRRSSGDVDTAVPDVLLPAAMPVVLEARGPDEPLAAMPVERLLLYPGDTHPLLLPPGEWVITAWTAQGARGEPVTVTIPVP